MLLKSDFEHLKANGLISNEKIEKLKQFPTVALWGTGRAANYAKKFLASKQIRLDCVTDSFSHQKGDSWQGLPLVDKNKIFRLGDSVIVVIACSFSYRIDRLLDERSISYILFDTNLHHEGLGEGESDPIDSKAEILAAFEQIQRVYSSLQDEKSKESYWNALAYRITLDELLLKQIYEPNTYFGNEVVPTFSGDTVVDCGAYTGDTIESFFRSGCFCKKYIALEPSPAQFDVLRQLIRSKGYQNVLALPLGAWSEKGVSSFSQNAGSANHIVKEGGCTIQTDRIDSITDGCHVDLIKMDIEGAEIPALKGAKKTILSDYPTLMVSLYHHLSDMWEIPLLIKSWAPDYKLYVRHHSLWGDDTVLYALKEK